MSAGATAAGADPLTDLVTDFVGGQDPEPVRFLDDSGNWSPSASAAAYEQYLADITLADKEQWYRDMVLTRAFDTECTNLQRQGQMALWVPSLGQEGCQVGIGHAANSADYIFPSYREHAVAKSRGIDLVDIAKQFRGFANAGWDPSDPKNGNFHIYTLVLGAHAQHAAGYALGQLLDAKAAAGVTALDPCEGPTPTGKATLAFYGDGTTSQGDASEAMVFAASYQAPVLFVVQNNQWAISVPVARQSRTPLYRRALGFGIPAVQIDGNDPLAAYAVAHAMLQRARDGHGPHFIEALTYRIGAHTTSDDPTRYRENAELECWKLKDPVARFAQHLRDSGTSEDFFIVLADEAKAYAQDVRNRVLSLPEPEPESMFDYAYAEEHRLVAAQQEWHRHYEDSFLAEQPDPVPHATPSAQASANTRSATVGGTTGEEGQA